MEIISSGIVAVSAGVSSSGLYVIQEGTLQILKNGCAGDIGLADGGKAIVSSGGDLYGCTVSEGGTATVLNEGYAQDVTVESGGMYLVSSGGTALKSIIQSGGTQIVYEETMATNATVMDGGVLHLSSGGYAQDPIVLCGGILHTWQGGISFQAQVYGTLEVDSKAGANNISIWEGGRLSVLSGGRAFEATVHPGGSIDVFSKGAIFDIGVNDGGVLKVYPGGVAKEIMENGGYVEVVEGANVTFASNTISGLEIASGNSASVHSGTTVNSAVVNSDSKLEVFSGGKMTGQMAFAEGAIVSAYENAALDFDISELAPGSVARVNNLSVVQGTPLYTLTVADSPETGIYSLADGASGFQSSITVVNTSGTKLGMLIVGDTLKIGEKDCTLNLNDSALTFVVKAQSPVPEELVGTRDRVSWETTEPERCVVEYSVDSFLHGIQVTTTTNALDMLALPAGTYQWRVRIDGSDQWAEGNEINSDNNPGTPKVLQSKENGNGDLFFATPNGTWGEDGNFAFAQHVGSINEWTGTNEIISANGKGRIQNLFFGSSDPNILCLTDDENGDAIFVDDVYTELPEGIEEQVARLYRIQEIRAGAGNDIVDMTSQRFKYIGDGIAIHGGAGNDTIWANEGNNMLFGDAGNDRIVGASGNDVIAGGIGTDSMHGGGGSDIFTFCENWGTDTVEQHSSGSVTLWFVSGSETNWDKSTLTYTDGDNSVTVKGVAAAQIELKFGENSPEDKEQFDLLSGTGSFLGFTSEQVFEEFGKGLLAN